MKLTDEQKNVSHGLDHWTIEVGLLGFGVYYEGIPLNLYFASRPEAWTAVENMVNDGTAETVIRLAREHVASFER